MDELFDKKDYLTFDEINNYDKTKDENLFNEISFLFYDLRDKKNNPINPIPKQSSRHMIFRHKQDKSWDKAYNGPVKKNDVKLFINKYNNAREVVDVFYQPKSVEHYENNLKKRIMEQLPKNFVMFEKVVHVEEIVYGFYFLKSHPKKVRESFQNGIVKFKHTSPDLIENLNKPVFDALEGLVIKNDALIGSTQKMAKIFAPVSYIYIKLRGF